jgi:hypothetical protein
LILPFLRRDELAGLHGNEGRKAGGKCGNPKNAARGKTSALPARFAMIRDNDAGR